MTERHSIKSNKDFRYDLKIGELYEQQLADILSNKTVEVKTDLLYYKTGNIFIEFECRGKLSGLATTKADHFAFILLAEDGTPSIHIFETAKLKKALKLIHKKEVLRTVNGGDDNLSRGYLVKFKKIIDNYGLD